MRGDNEMVDIFNISNVDFEYSKDDKSVDSIYFSPNPAKYPKANGLYKATIRFIPFYLDPPKSKISKEIAYLTDPYTQEKKNVDSYKSLGKAEGRKCPIMKHYWWLYNNEDASLQAKTDLFKQSKRFFSLVQILDDELNPDNVGKILIWGFGTKINEKFMAELEGTKRGSKLIPGVNPFDLFSGNPMEVNVSMNGQYPNYDKCEFFQLDDNDDFGRPIYPLKTDSDGKVTEWGVVTKDDKKSQKAFLDYLSTNSPDLVEECGFKPWDNETKEFVQRCIDASKGEYASTAIDSSMDDDEDVVVSSKIQTTKSAPAKAKPAPAKKAKATVVEDEVDDILEDDDDDMDLDDFDLDDDFGAATSNHY